MSRTIVTSALGLLAAGALLVVNGTYASWNDSATVGGNRVGASSLQLSVTSPGTEQFNIVDLLPGGAATFESFITSRDREAVPQADLTLRIDRLVDTEDGCTTSSEAAVDDCATNQVGDFSSTGYVVVDTSLPTTDPAACDQTVHPRTSVLPNGVRTLEELSDFGSLNLLRDGPLKPGEGICVAMAIGLAPSAGNAVQGDSVSFDARFDLSQHVSSL
jgi:predicted ribosomally synthesized peptide with SipW-like signal peptide